MSIYLDEVWLLNTLLDYLLLVSAAQISGRRIRRLRFLAVAAVGGTYAVATFFWPPLRHPVIYLLFGPLLSGIAFYGEQKKASACTLFLLLSAALAGLLMAFGLTTVHISWPVLLISSGVFTLLLELILRQTTRFGRNDIKPIRIAVGERVCTLRALRDTGNTLRSPITGVPVLVAELSALHEFWSREEAAILRADLAPQEKVAQMYALGNTRFSLLPYTAVGGSGLLLCMRSDTVTAGRHIYRRAPVALVEHSLGRNYDALWGGEEESDVFTSLHTCADTAQAG